jgi:hypothetical protein
VTTPATVAKVTVTFDQPASGKASLDWMLVR